jgi:hypothetical protein
MPELPEELQHLKNMISEATSGLSIKMLRDEIKSAADELPAADVVKIAKAILQCGIDNDRGNWAVRN